MAHAANARTLPLQKPAGSYATTYPLPPPPPTRQVLPDDYESNSKFTYLEYVTCNLYVECL